MHLQTFFLQAAVKQKKFVLIQMVDTLRRSVRAHYNTDKDLKKKKKNFAWFKCTLIKSKNKNMEVEMSKTGPL